MSFFFFFVILALLINNTSAKICYSCDSSKGETCEYGSLSRLLELISIVNCDTMCYVAKLPDDNIKRGCTELRRGFWDEIAMEKGVHVCPRVDNQTSCTLCDNDWCNNVAKKKISLMLFMLTGITMGFL